MIPQVLEEETDFILKNAKETLDLDGDFVELGCYRGDTSVLLARILQEKRTDFDSKRLFLYDSFAGLPEKDMKDCSPAGEQFRKGELLASKSELIMRFKRMRLRLPVIRKGFFSDLKDCDLPEKIAFAFLDGDLYCSIRDSLAIIEGKLTNGAVILIHDYVNPALPGVAKATDEWLKKIGQDDVKFSTHKSIAKIKWKKPKG